MPDFYSVLLKTVVAIDGKEYIISACDFSESVSEAIADGICDASAEEIIDFVTQN